MDSTNYYIVHKSGRKLKISCYGYTHNAEMRDQTRKQIARIEHHREKDYRVETEKAVEIIKGADGKQRRAEFAL